MLPIQKYIEHFTEVWEKSPNHLPAFSREYSNAEQLIRENNYNKFQLNLKKLQSHKAAFKIRNNKENPFFPLFKNFLETVFDFEKRQLKIILSEQFKNVSKDFFYKARKFGSELEPVNIYQGMRNVWIMNGIQFMMDVPVEISPSVFAYSMIYPYSDNFLDDITIGDVDKKEFSRRFNMRLHGENVEPFNFIEEQLFKLVGMFEFQFPRNEFSGVYESLYAIQQGQTNSLKLLQSNGLSEKGIKDICFEKGGASVLADGYLVAGKLSQEQEQALFGYGIYLQLLDDIQDVKEDLKAETKTMFSFLNQNDLGGYVNQSIHFGRYVLERMKCFSGVQNIEFLDLMNRSIETMIIESVGLNHTRYSVDYLKEIEKFSPLHFNFIRNKRSESKSQRFSIFQKYFDREKSEAVK